jgi:hypothetical protein
MQPCTGGKYTVYAIGRFLFSFYLFDKTLTILPAIELCWDKKNFNQYLDISFLNFSFVIEVEDE